MNTLSEEDLKAAHVHSSHHRDELLKSRVCGCFYCEETFLPTEITEWVDEDSCALCPKCEIDSVIGDASGYEVTSREFLHQMHAYWFEK